MQRSTVVLPQPDGPNSAVTPALGRLERDVEREAARACPRKRAVDRAACARSFAGRASALLDQRHRQDDGEGEDHHAGRQDVRLASIAASRRSRRWRPTAPWSRPGCCRRSSARRRTRRPCGRSRAPRRSETRPRQRHGDGPEGVPAARRAASRRPRAAGRRSPRRHCGSAARRTASNRAPSRSPGPRR